MEARKCPVCGGEVNFSYITPDKVFRINEAGMIVRDDNNCYGPTIEFHCSEDMEHDLDSDKEMLAWEDEIEEVFFDQNIFDL